MDLHLVWFGLLGILLAGYAVLDGFDLGVGILHPLAKSDLERRTFVNAIGPLWDGNEVWLVTFGGALFAMFPEAYATVFSGFYLAFMLLLFALILRAVSLEFRSKVEASGWRTFWDGGFFLSSLVATLLFGVAVGNAILGIPLDARGVFAGGFLDLLRPYPILVGLLAVALFAEHGAIFLYLKTEGSVQERLGRWMWHTWGAFLVLYLMTTIYTLIAIPTAVRNFESHPWAAAIVVLNILAIANVPRALFRRKYGQAFLSSTLTIACMVALFGLAIFPNLVVASDDPARSWTIYNAASSAKTLKLGLWIALVGMPFVLAYTGIIYWTFRGKVVLSEHSY
ncbi:MAG TPA: cytochrome d ubiquinol oxidase subunit II [Candidatus Polarisedimenticolaceae bacterium]